MRFWNVAARLRQDAKRKPKNGMQNVQRSNPHLEEIIRLFDSEITMFNDMK